MWLFFGLMGVLLASSVVDSPLRAGGGGGNDDDEDDDPAGGAPDDPWLDDWDDDEYISDDSDPPEDGEDDDGGDAPPPGDDDNPGDEDPGERPPDDPWLDGWDDDEYISSDDDPPGEGDEGDDGDPPPGEGDDDPDEGAERPPEDPWLDGWEDDEYISSDALSLALARAEDDDALHVLGSGDRLQAGDGGVYVLGDWIDPADPVVIGAFQPGTDQIIYAHVAGAGAPQISLADAPAAEGAVLLVDGQQVLRFDSGAAPPAESILLFPVGLGP